MINPRNVCILGLVIMAVAFVIAWYGVSLLLLEVAPAMFIGGSLLVGFGVIAAEIGRKSSGD